MTASNTLEETRPAGDARPSLIEQPSDGASATARLLALALVVLALAPVIVVVLERTGRAYTPIGDMGAIDLRVREVWTMHPPLVGPYGNHGWDHLGPILFYLLALPSLLAGQAAWGTEVGAALLQGLAVVWLASLAWRRGGLPLLATVMAAIGLLALTLPTAAVRDPWNPYVAVPFFALFVFQAWLLAEGDARKLPGAVAVGSFLVQTHVGYVPLVVAGAFVVVAYRLVDLRHERPVGSTSWAVMTRWSLVVFAVLWLPPAIDWAQHPPGNLGAVVEYFAAPKGSITSRLGLGAGARLLASEFRFVPDWLRGGTDIGFGAVATGSSLVWLLVPVSLVIVGVVVARRRGDEAVVRFLVLASVLAIASCIAFARLEGAPFPYLILWRPVIALAIAAGAAWSLLGAARSVRARPVAVALVAVVLLGWSFDHYALAVARDAGTEIPVERATASLSRQLRQREVPTRGVILRLQWSSYVQLQRGILDELLRHGMHVYVDESQAYQYGDGRAADVGAVAQVWWVAESGSALAELSARPGAKVIASWSPLPPRRERQARRLSAELLQQLYTAGRADLVPFLDNVYLALVTADVPGVDHDAARALLALNDEANRRGGGRSGVVAFPAFAAPDHLLTG